MVERNKYANQLLLNKTKQNHYYFLHFLNCYNPLKWLCCSQEVVICRGSYPSDMYNPRLTNGEEKSLRHVAMVVKVLDDNKPIKSFKSTISNFTDLIQFHLIWQILAKFSLGPYLLLSKLRKSHNFQTLS